MHINHTIQSNLYTTLFAKPEPIHINGVKSTNLYAQQYKFMHKSRIRQRKENLRGLTGTKKPPVLAKPRTF